MNKLLTAVSIHRAYYYVPKLFNVYSLLQLRGEFETSRYSIFNILFNILTTNARCTGADQLYLYRCYISYDPVHITSVICLYTKKLNEYSMIDDNDYGYIRVPSILELRGII